MLTVNRYVITVGLKQSSTHNSADKSLDIWNDIVESWGAQNYSGRRILLKTNYVDG